MNDGLQQQNGDKTVLIEIDLKGETSTSVAKMTGTRSTGPVGEVGGSEMRK